MLTDRARTRHELAEVLEAEGVEPRVSAAVLDRLVELRLIDDAAYAEAFVRGRQRAGVAKRTMTRELRAKGVGEQEAESALEIIEPDQEREAAVTLASRRAARMSGLPAEVQRRRLYGLLARRGYPSDVVGSVVNQVLGEQQDDADNDSEIDPDEQFASVMSDMHGS